MIIPVVVNEKLLKKCKTLIIREFTYGDLIRKSTGEFYIYMGKAMNATNNSKMVSLKQVSDDPDICGKMLVIEYDYFCNTQLISTTKKGNKYFVYEKVDTSDLIKKRL